jgi:thiamine-phosphate pyrophosphorylase
VLLLVTDRKQATRPLLDVVEECLEAGLRAVQLREKDLPVRGLLALATPLRETTRRHAARLFINDRVDVALAVGADGAQRTHDSLPVSVMRAIGGPGFTVGASVHSVGEARAAAVEGADFIIFGPVFDTPSKRSFGPPQGLEALRQVTAAVATPVLAIGGITAARVRDVLAAGAAGVGVISGILAAARPREATRSFLDALGSA